MDDDEILDLVDDHDRVVGTVNRTHADGHGFLRAAEIFIQNSHGQLWTPRRQLHKRIAPGGLDYAVSGHVGSGESYIQAALREAAEELNLELDEKDLIFIKKFAPIENLDYFRAVYLYKTDRYPLYNKEDFSEFYWLTPHELLAKLKAGEPAKRSLAETVAYLIEHGF